YGREQDRAIAAVRRKRGVERSLEEIAQLLNAESFAHNVESYTDAAIVYSWMMIGGHGRVLVVEDEAAIRGALIEALADEGYDTVAAANGAIALDVVREAPPDVIILDLMMPVMDGWQFLSRCREDDLC